MFPNSSQQHNGSLLSQSRQAKLSTGEGVELEQEREGELTTGEEAVVSNWQKSPWAEGGAILEPRREGKLLKAKSVCEVAEPAWL